jgi:hypothetical protein
MMGEKKPKRNCSQEYLKEKQANIQSDATSWPFNMSTQWTQDMTGTGSYLTLGDYKVTYK